MNETATLQEYVEGLVETGDGDRFLDIELLLESGFTELICMDLAKFVVERPEFRKHRGRKILTVNGGAGEALSVTVE